MTVSLALPTGGYAGWRHLQRTRSLQEAVVAASPSVSRLADHFRARIGGARTAEALVADPRLLEVALGAFGLGGDLGARAFVRRVLEGGTLDPRSLANRLADKRYAALAREFGFGDLGARTDLPGFADRILARFERQVLAEAAGARDPALRLAVHLGPALEDLAARAGSPNAQWYGVMSEPPLREVFVTAFGFPPSFGALDVDRQLAAFRRSAAALGAEAPADFRDPALQDRLMRLFFLRRESGAAAPAAAPILALLRGGG